MNNYLILESGSQSEIMSGERKYTLVFVLQQESECRLREYQNDHRLETDCFREPVSRLMHPDWGWMLAYKAEWISKADAKAIREFVRRELHDDIYAQYCLIWFSENLADGAQYLGHAELCEELGIAIEFALEIKIPLLTPTSNKE